METNQGNVVVGVGGDHESLGRSLYMGRPFWRSGGAHKNAQLLLSLPLEDRLGFAHPASCPPLHSDG